MAYDSNPLRIGIVKLGIIPKTAVQNTSLRIFATRFALSGTFSASPFLTGETTSRNPTLGRGRSPGVATLA